MKTKTKDKYKFTIQTKITPEVYRNFARFDTFVLKKRWAFPLFGVLCLLALAGIFYMTQMGLLAVISAVFAVAFVIIYFRTFSQIMQDNTHNAPYNAVIDTYIVSLTDEGLEVYSEQEQAECTWDELYAAYLLSNCIALFLKKEQSFVITESDPKRFAAIWDFICDRAGHKAKDRRSAVA